MAVDDSTALPGCIYILTEIQKLVKAIIPIYEELINFEITKY